MADFSPEQALSPINRLVDQQAFVLAANDLFYGSAILFLLLISLVWLVKPARNGDASDAAAGAH